MNCLYSQVYGVHPSQRLGPNKSVEQDYIAFIYSQPKSLDMVQCTVHAIPLLQHK